MQRRCHDLRWGVLERLRNYLMQDPRLGLARLWVASRVQALSPPPAERWADLVRAGCVPAPLQLFGGVSCMYRAEARASPLCFSRALLCAPTRQLQPM